MFDFLARTQRSTYIHKLFVGFCMHKLLLLLSFV